MKKMPLFSRPRSPAEIVRNLKEALNTLERGGDSKKQEKVRKNSTDLITFIVSSASKNGRGRKYSPATPGGEDEAARKIRLFLQVWSSVTFLFQPGLRQAFELMCSNNHVRGKLSKFRQEKCQNIKLLLDMVKNWWVWLNLGHRSICISCRWILG